MSAPLKFELDRRQGVLNIGYGAGSSPSFTNLTVTNTLTVGGSVHGANGSAANPSFAFNSDQNTGLYRIGADNIGVAANGAFIGNIVWAIITKNEEYKLEHNGQDMPFVANFKNIFKIK